MKNKLSFISVFVLALIPFVAPWEGGPRVTGGYATEGIQVSEAYKNASSFMPVFETGIADLEVRDLQNRAIQTPTATAQLRQIFLEGLFNLTVKNDLRIVQEALTALEYYSALFNKLLLRIDYALFKALPDVLLPAVKRFVHNVDKVWTTFFVGVLMAFAASANLIQKPGSKILALRC